MRTRALGPDASHVRTVGFGGMPLSTNNRPATADAIRVIHEVLDAGVTLLDTADSYCLDHTEIGHNERLFATALNQWTGKREDVVVATKAGMTRPDGRWEQNAHPDHLHRACDASLKALGTDRIDLYQLHWPDSEVPFADSVGALSELRDAGKIRWVGLSNVSVEQLREAQAIVPIQTVQNRLNLFFREALTNDVVDVCGREGIGFLAYSPVGGGRLHKKLPDHPVVTAIADAHEASPHEVALAWCLAQGPTVFVIPGARSAAHALSSIRAGELVLDAAERQSLDDATFDAS